jgi:hypothetical protein
MVEGQSGRLLGEKEKKTKEMNGGVKGMVLGWVG